MLNQYIYEGKKTSYKNNVCDSGVEADWNCLFDVAGFNWERAKPINIDSTEQYTPDFIVYGVHAFLDTFNQIVYDINIEIKSNVLTDEARRKMELFSHSHPLLTLGELPKGNSLRELFDSIKYEPFFVLSLPSSNGEPSSINKVLPCVAKNGDIILATSKNIDSIDALRTINAYNKANEFKRQKMYPCSVPIETLSDEEQSFIQFLENNPRVRKTTRTVYITDDYSIFKHSYYNRDIDDRKVQEFVDDNDIKDVVYPVNSKGEILDGQHRIKACSILKQPVTFEVITGITDSYMAQINKNGRPWGKIEWINHFKKLGLLDYQVAHKLIVETKRVKPNYLTYATLQRCEGGVKSMMNILRKGELHWYCSPYFILKALEFFNDVRFVEPFDIVFEASYAKCTFLNFCVVLCTAEPLGLSFEHFKSALIENRKKILPKLKELNKDYSEVYRYIYNLKNKQNKYPKVKITPELMRRFSSEKLAGKYRDEEVLKQFLNDSSI